MHDLQRQLRMRDGKYFQIPDRPSDIECLWATGKPLDASIMPEWLMAQDAAGYRYVGKASCAGLVLPERDLYFGELEALELAGMIVEEDPVNQATHHVYLSEPMATDAWSIGIYCGKGPFDLAPAQHAANPVLTREDVSDVPATLVADPFMIKVKKTWHMFFEVFNWLANKGEIGLAVSEDGVKWKYQQIVLAEEFHLSYPSVFEWMGDYYMVPESYQAGAIRLYKAEKFPHEWSFIGNILAGPYLVDPSIVRYRDQWWMFVETNPEIKHDTLRLYYADHLTGPWQEHPQSPIVQGDAGAARPAGRFLVIEDRVVRLAQNCWPTYGTAVRAFEVTNLTRESYDEREISHDPILGPGAQGWNNSGMHHLDAHRVEEGNWFACVDGWTASAQ
jgi:hypothetical protein